ncbi:hypothetical protein AURDEDRAFT_181738 [Auricularia subglabra TFB-10046 SS5]|nr:hypothetical protein AURDEDRAFT_181738 [Auricularia subglabra TFB-10046 SS5]
MAAEPTPTVTIGRRPSVRAKRETLPSTFPKELLRNPFGLPLPVELPPVPPLSTGSVPPSPRQTIAPVPGPASAAPRTHTPRTPLAPHKLAAIANALGVHAPAPASSHSPSAKSPAVSRFLLHVIPPRNIQPIDDDDDEDDDGSLSPYPKAAPGYHTQFTRGTLIQLQPTLASMLGAIAREYALPSTGGLILYLFQGGEPGPRITDDAWKLLWFKALKAEREDSFRALQALPSSASEKGASSPASSYPSPASSEAHGSGLELTSPSPLSLPIIAKVEFDIDRRKATWFAGWLKTRHLRRRPSTPGSAHSVGYEYPLPLELSNKRSRASSLMSARGRADTGSSAGLRSQFSLSASDKADADEEVEGVTRRVGLGYSTPRRRRGGGQVPPPLKVLSDSPVDLEDDDSSHLAYRILIDGPPEGDDDLSFLGRAHYDPRASHIIMKENLDTLEKAMRQYSPRLEKSVEEEHESEPQQPTSASTQSLTPTTARTQLSPTMPSPDAFGEPPSWPHAPFASNGNPLYSPGIGGSPARQTPTSENFKFPEAPPKLTINGKPQQQPPQSPGATQSPGYPLSPDPFATKSFGEAMMAAKDGKEAPPPPRGSSLPGSRFSQDSMNDDVQGRERTNSIISKGFRRLWRKSSASSLAAASGKVPGSAGVPPLPPMSPIPSSPHPSSGGGSMAAQQAAFMQQQAAMNPPQSPSLSLSESDTASVLASPSGKRGSDLDPFHFDQESRYPNHPAARAQAMAAAGVPPTSPPPSAGANGNQGSVGKRSILKSWRTRSPSVSSTNTADLPPPPPPVQDMPPPVARKRPSVLGIGSPRSARSGSVASTATFASAQQGAQTLQAFLNDDPSLQSGPAPTRSGFI